MAFIERRAGLTPELGFGRFKNRDVFVPGYMDVFMPVPKPSCGGRPADVGFSGVRIECLRSHVSKVARRRRGSHAIIIIIIIVTRSFSYRMQPAIAISHLIAKLRFSILTNKKKV